MKARLVLFILCAALSWGCAHKSRDRPDVKKFPADNECAAPGEIEFIINVGYDVKHKSCIGDLEALTSLITIAIRDDECKIRPTNLVTYWNGCMYILWQINSPKDLVYVGIFKDLDTIGEFIKTCRPIFSSQ